MKKIILFIFLFLTNYLCASTVHKIQINGVINPVAAEYIQKSIDRAQEQEIELLVIELDTPGGLMESMHQIVKSIQSSKVPIAVYVSPSGSRAGSAGVFITYAAHIAAMAPSTNIGSAHPVFGGGVPGAEPDSGTTETMMEKVTNDAVAKIKAVAKKRGRNVEWAEKSIRESANITETEALKLNVIEYIAPSVDSLLVLLDGKIVKMDSGAEIKLETSNTRIESYEMDWREKLLDTLANPNIAYILMFVAMYGILLELYNPGSILPGVLGGIALILWLYSFHTLPVNYAGLLLIVFSVVLFLLEIKIPSFGILSIGGVISLVLGSIMLFDSDLPFFAVSWQLIVAVAIFSTLFFIFAIGMALRAQQKQPTTGTEGLIGETGEVFKALHPKGKVLVHGELWTAISTKPVAKGSTVIVTGFDKTQFIIHVEEV